MKSVIAILIVLSSFAAFAEEVATDKCAALADGPGKTGETISVETPSDSSGAAKQ